MTKSSHFWAFYINLSLFGLFWASLEETGFYIWRGTKETESSIATFGKETGLYKPSKSDMMMWADLGADWERLGALYGRLTCMFSGLDL